MVWTLRNSSSRLKEAAASLRDAELMGSECSKMVHSDSGPSPQADGSGDSTHLHFVTMVNVARLEEDIFLALARCVASMASMVLQCSMIILW